MIGYGADIGREETWENVLIFWSKIRRIRIGLNRYTWRPIDTRVKGEEIIVDDFDSHIYLPPSLYL